MRRASELFDSQPRSPEDEKRKREVGSITCYLEKGGGGRRNEGKAQSCQPRRKCEKKCERDAGEKTLTHLRNCRTVMTCHNSERNRRRALQIPKSDVIVRSAVGDGESKKKSQVES